MSERVIDTVLRVLRDVTIENTPGVARVLRAVVRDPDRAWDSKARTVAETARTMGFAGTTKL